MKSESTQLAPVERAAYALKSAERKDVLRALVKESADLVEVRDQVARDQIHGAYMRLKNSRVALEKDAAALREDAKAFNLAMIAEEKALLAITDPEETRLKTLRDDFDQAAERERQAKAEIERTRIAALQDDIQAMRNYVAQFLGASSERLTEIIAEVQGVNMERFAELKADAEAARAETLAGLTGLRAEAKAREDEAARQVAEAARLKAEREQFDREQAEARERMAAQEREAAALRAAEQKRLDEQQAEIRRQQEAVDRARREQEDRERAAAQAEEDRLRAERQRVEDEAAALRRAAEEEAIQRARKSADRVFAEKMRAVEAQHRLQSAAPALLNALQLMEAAMTEGADTKEQRHAMRMALIAARAAIALATEEEIPA